MNFKGHRDMVKDGKHLSIEDLEAVVTICCEKYDIKPVPIRSWTNHRRGRAKIGQGYITLPTWPMENHGTDYMIAYAIHEAAHFVLWYKDRHHGHGPGFKRVEEELLKQFGYKPKFYRNRAYYDELYTDEGRMIFNSGRQRIMEEPKPKIETSTSIEPRGMRVRWSYSGEWGNDPEATYSAKPVHGNVKFAGKNGKTWDLFGEAESLDKTQKWEAWIDTTWGHWVYFIIKGEDRNHRLYKFNATKPRCPKCQKLNTLLNTCKCNKENES